MFQTNNNKNAERNWRGNLKPRGNLEDFGIDGRIILTFWHRNLAFKI
jgi:hypothetical protein